MKTVLKNITFLLIVLLAASTPWIVSAQVINKPIQISHDFAENEEIYANIISPDGKTVVYTVGLTTGSASNNTVELYSAPITGGKVTRLNLDLPDRGRVSDFEISADSQRVVYKADQEKYFEDELYSVPITGGQVTKLNTDLVRRGDVFSFKITTDGQRVIYRAQQDSAEQELYGVPITGGQVVKLSGESTQGYIEVDEYRISPDNQHVIYNIGLELYSVPITGGDSTKLNTGFPNDSSLALAGFGVVEISPDSQRVVYTADQDSRRIREIYSVSIDGGTVTKLNPTFSFLNALSSPSIEITPDSQRVIYRTSGSNNGTGMNELHSVPIVGGQATKLNTDSNTSGRELRWWKISANSQTVVYSSVEEYGNFGDIFSVPVSGGPVTQLNTNDVDAFTRTQISPDNQWLVYIGNQNNSLNLYSVPVLGGEVIKLRSNLNASGVIGFNLFRFDISTDSQRVIYNSSSVNNYTDPDELYSVAIEGGSSTKLISGLPFNSIGIDRGFFHVSSDGAYAIYRGDHNESDKLELFSVQINKTPIVPTASGFSVTAVDAVEGEKALFTITLDEPQPTLVGYDFSTLAGTAIDGEDYVGRVGRILFPAGETVRERRVTILEDGVQNEGNEIFSLVVTDINNASATVTTQATIQEPLPELSVARTFAREGDGKVVVAISLSEPSTEQVTVKFRTFARPTQSNPATDGEDYIGRSGTIIFPSGATRRTRTMMLIDDVVDEANEVFRFELSEPSNADIALGSERQRVFILDDD